MDNIRQHVCPHFHRKKLCHYFSDSAKGFCSYFSIMAMLGKQSEEKR